MRVYSVCLDLLLRKKKRNLERRTWALFIFTSDSGRCE
jgi:hypothetical protein